MAKPEQIWRIIDTTTPLKTSTGSCVVNNPSGGTTMRGIGRTGVTFVVCFVCVIQLFTCIFDRILHTVFIFSLFVAGVFVFAWLYAQRQELRFKGWSAAFAVLAVFTMLTSSLWSLKAFHSIEMFNAGIGYVSVKVFDHDAYCFSNGRESKITAALPRDLYITDRTETDENIIGFFTEKYPELIHKYREDRNAIGFYTNNDLEQPLLVVTKHSHNGYVIWEVLAIDAYRHKNILGRTDRFSRPGIHPR